MTRLGSFKSQAPSSKEVPSPKPQRAALDGGPHRSGLGLELLWSLELGAWCFGGRRIPPKTAKIRQVHALANGLVTRTRQTMLAGGSLELAYGALRIVTSSSLKKYSNSVKPGPSTSVNTSAKQSCPQVALEPRSKPVLNPCHQFQIIVYLEPQLLDCGSALPS